MDEMQTCLAGEKLWGDDFTPEQIALWYEDEKEGYAELGSKDRSKYKFPYHVLNAYHGFDHLPDQRFRHVLGFGAAYGDELEPLAPKIDEITIIEPSDALVADSVHGIPTTYVKPVIDGTLPFDDETFDLVTCLGVLHHIPNVTFVVNQLYRCMCREGYAVLREPIVSMGDWSKPRPYLTKRERGIPLKILRQIVRDAGFQVVREGLCKFPVVPKLAMRLKRSPYSDPSMTRLDAILSRLMGWNVTYHARNRLRKLRPASVYLVLRK